jgi:hypothetical protein
VLAVAMLHELNHQGTSISNQTKFLILGLLKLKKYIYGKRSGITA